jgi:hypothetical protein
MPDARQISIITITLPSTSITGAGGWWDEGEIIHSQEEGLLFCFCFVMKKLRKLKPTTLHTGGAVA